MLRENLRKWREAHGGKVPGHRGVPNGWAGAKRRRLLAEIRETARIKADKVLEKLIENGTVQKDCAGNAVLGWAIQVVLAKTDEGHAAYPVRDQLTAAKMVLEYTMQKPVTKAEVTHTAESFLTGLLEESKKED